VALQAKIVNTSNAPKELTYSVLPDIGFFFFFFFLYEQEALQGIQSFKRV
jgi:hypothetical protein